MFLPDVVESHDRREKTELMEVGCCFFLFVCCCCLVLLCFVIGCCCLLLVILNINYPFFLKKNLALGKN